MDSGMFIHYDARVTLKTYLPVKRIGNKFLVLPRHHDGYNPLSYTGCIIFFQFGLLAIRRWVRSILTNTYVFSRLNQSKRRNSDLCKLEKIKQKGDILYKMAETVFWSSSRPNGQKPLTSSLIYIIHSNIKVWN